MLAFRVSRAWAIALGVVLLGAVVLFVVDHSYSIYDDTYIYLRYVKNVRAGCGLRFNCGDAPVEGFTSPLYLASLTAGSFVVPDLEALTQLFGTLFLTLALAVTATTTTRISRSGGPSTVIAMLGVAAILGVDHRVLLNAVTGLETALTCLVLALFVRAAFDPHLRGLRVLAVLAVLSRPECLIFVGFLPVLSRARSLRYLAPVALAMVAIVAIRWAIFGALVPNTYLAKSGGTLAHARLGAEYALTAVSEFPAIALAPLALLVRGRGATVAWFLVSSLVWFAFFLRSGGDAYRYSRLALPLVPTLTSFAVVGVAAAFERLPEGLPRLRAARVPALALVLLVFSLRVRAAHATDPQHGFANVRGYEQVGAFLHAWHPGASVATVPVGAIGYLSEGPIYDLVGVVSREVASAGRGLPPGQLTRALIGHERHNTRWVLAQQPEIIVTSMFRRRGAGAPALTRAWWTDVDQLGLGLHSEELILREVRAGRAPYRLYNAEVAPGLYWVLLLRDDLSLHEPENPPWI